MNISKPQDLKKIILHYENKLKIVNKEGEEDLVIQTDLCKGFIKKVLETIPQILGDLGDKDRQVELYEVTYPIHRTISCLALNQYIKDLNSDKKILESELSFKPTYLTKIQDEIERAELLKKECSCDSKEQEKPL